MFHFHDVVRHPVVADIINAYEKDAPKVDLEKKSEETNQAKEEVSGLTEYPVIGAEDIKNNTKRGLRICVLNLFSFVVMLSAFPLFLVK